jgi:hypothetical protein
VHIWNKKLIYNVIKFYELFDFDFGSLNWDHLE